MRTPILLFLVALLCTTAAFGQEAGDRIVVTTNNAHLKTRNDIVGFVPKGKSLTVKEVNGDWFWVTYFTERGTTKGWINRRDVIPVEERASILWYRH
jgi:uncharacterized protein YgiM (DUF1202 family)